MMKCQQSGCNGQFKSRDALVAHSQASHNLFMCTTKGCLKQLSSSVARADHMRTRHSSQAPTSKPTTSTAFNPMKGYFACGVCPRSFPTVAGRNQHREEKHQMPRPPLNVTACSDCGKSFPSNDALRQHQISTPGHTQLSRAQGSSQCSSCNRTSRDQNALEQHFVADHSLEKLGINDGEGAKFVRDFKNNWRKPTAIPKVLSVYKIYNLSWRMNSFTEYKAKVSVPSNVVTRYHGTTVRCDLGAETSTKLCANTSCGLCGIIRSGFKTAKARTGWQRFGPGIYTTATSGKSNDYVRTESAKRAVLVCQVVAGTVFRTKQDMPFLKGPPENCDSVSGEVGEDLNYDETVVYSSKAVLPKHLLIYQL